MYLLLPTDYAALTEVPKNAIEFLQTFVKTVPSEILLIFRELS
jgi:hypothetical protein